MVLFSKQQTRKISGISSFREIYQKVQKINITTQQNELSLKFCVFINFTFDEVKCDVKK